MKYHVTIASSKIITTVKKFRDKKHNNNKYSNVWLMITNGKVFLFATDKYILAINKIIDMNVYDNSEISICIPEYILDKIAIHKGPVDITVLQENTLDHLICSVQFGEQKIEWQIEPKDSVLWLNDSTYIKDNAEDQYYVATTTAKDVLEWIKRNKRGWYNIDKLCKMCITKDNIHEISLNCAEARFPMSYDVSSTTVDPFDTHFILMPLYDPNKAPTTIASLDTRKFMSILQTMGSRQKVQIRISSSKLKGIEIKANK